VYVVRGDRVRWRPAIRWERIALAALALGAFAAWISRPSAVTCDPKM
jgi:hypothetical protein